MTVYLEPPNINLLDRVNWARMTADSVEELQAFAGALGLQPHHFYNHRIPHYRLSPGKQIAAIDRGAVELPSFERLEQIARQERERRREQQEAAETAKEVQRQQDIATRREQAIKEEQARLKKNAKNRKNHQKAKRRGPGVALSSEQPDANSTHGLQMSGKRGTPKGIRHA